jgi:colanic acid/amylovoran biosynthesis glycosyltransferase
VGNGMSRIAYLAKSFPEQGEPYVWEEIQQLRQHQQEIICCSFRRPAKIPQKLAPFSREALYVLPVGFGSALRATVFLLGNVHLVLDLLWRAINGPQPIQRRFRTLAHSWLGACLAARLNNQNISHIHVHHGYFASWAGMVAARFLNASFSMTLHGSDLLVRADYLDTKLRECKFCVTVSEFNRNCIRAKYPEIDHDKILVHRLGVDPDFWHSWPKNSSDPAFSILSVGRLHPVKNHEFLISACAELKRANLDFRCIIAGEGPEHQRLQGLIESLGLVGKVELRGDVPREELPHLYREADVIAFTSHSEGIPVAAMEAMAMERIVLAPKITGIPELIDHHQTGFLYEPNSMEDFLVKLTEIRINRSFLKQVREAARKHVDLNFNQGRNLEKFAADFLFHVDARKAGTERNDADLVLQQI